MLRLLGDLSEAEIAARADCGVAPALRQLADERRAIPVKVAGEPRWIAAEQAAVYRDALGVMPPPGLPAGFLEAPDNPLAVLAQRYAKTHGPFVTADLASRLGLRPAQLEPALRALLNEGLLIQGEIRPGGSQLDWCDAEILRRLKRRTLAKLRDAVAPVDAATFGLFLPRWQELGSERGGMARLLEVVHQLEGLDLPWSALHQTLLPARVADFSVDMLDMLAATGQIVWVGAGALGTRDGRIRQSADFGVGRQVTLHRFRRRRCRQCHRRASGRDLVQSGPSVLRRLPASGTRRDCRGLHPAPEVTDGQAAPR